jgi:2-methylisocitrate lyase-like PEP mutase family enzyme
LAVKLADGKNGLSVEELGKLGVCRISVGAGLYCQDMDCLRKKAERILGGGQLWSEED